MRIFVFESQSRKGLHAFAGDKTGSRLPGSVGPWRLLFGSETGRSLPHGISRPPIEEAIVAEGFQLWRLKVAAEEAAQAAKGGED